MVFNFTYFVVFFLNFESSNRNHKRYKQEISIFIHCDKNYNDIKYIVHYKKVDQLEHFRHLSVIKIISNYKSESTVSVCSDQ